MFSLHVAQGLTATILRNASCSLPIVKVVKGTEIILKSVSLALCDKLVRKILVQISKFKYDATVEMSQ